MAKTTATNVDSERLRSREIVIYVLGLLSGSKRKVHLEDITIKCYQLFPDKFAWSKHDYPDKHLTRTRLSSNIGHGLVETKDSHWSLTADGVEWLTRNKTVIESILGTEKVSGGFKMTKQEQREFIKHIEDQGIYGAWADLDVGLENTTEFQLADLLDCLPETPSDNKLSKLHIMRSKAALIQREDIQRFLVECEDHFFGE